MKHSKLNNRNETSWADRDDANSPPNPSQPWRARSAATATHRLGRCMATAAGILLVAASVLAQGVEDDGRFHSFHPTRLLAKYARDTGAKAAVSVLANQGIVVIRQVSIVPGLVVLEVGKTDGTDPAKLPGEEATNLLERIKALRDSGAFEYVEPDYRVSADRVPSEPEATNGVLWGLHNPGLTGATSDVDIDAPEAWNIGVGSTNVIVAVIDTGIRYTHQDLITQMWRNPGEIPGNGRDDDLDGFVDNIHGVNTITGSGDPFDDNDHGTHVAGTIGAAANNGHPAVGVAWQVRLMACKFLDASGGGWNSDAIEGIGFAVAKGAKVLNNSWGGGGYSQALHDAIAAARAAGVLFVAAAGNSSEDTDSYPHYPSCYDLDNIISVAAHDSRERLASFSNFGQSSVDLAAPGVSIPSCTAGSDSEYGTFSGTSMAAPHVSGVAALIWSQFPALQLPGVRQRLLNTTVSAPAYVGRCATEGRLNALNALTAAADGRLEIRLATSIVPLIGGREASLLVEVLDFDPVTNATVTGTIEGGGTLAFSNAGHPPDQVAGDHRHAASLTVPFTTNLLSVRVSVSAPGKSSITLTQSFPVRVPPGNDSFAQRMVLNGPAAALKGSNRDATRETGEPNHAGNRGGASVWWSWTAPSTGVVQIHTEGSSFDTILGIYTGTVVSNLVRVASDDDSGAGLASAVTFTANAGNNYQIALDGYSGAEGMAVLTIAYVATNDAFASRTRQMNADFWLTVNSAGATKEIGEPDHGGNVGGKSLWWEWTAPTSGNVQVKTEGSSFDTLLGIYEGTSVSGLTLVAANDDADSQLTSTVSFLARAGGKYQIAVDGYGGASGTVYLTLTGIRPRLLPPQRLVDGTFRIWIANSDGSQPSPATATSIRIYASTNAASPVSHWSPLSGILQSAGGLMWIDDPMARTLPARFYRLVQVP